ncbi:twin-arginine translocation signal domain-containing protein [Natronococcus occultus]|uniref:Copper-binding protein, plastocyanin family n=1 Tax=Natronococcus occultus SP4 TaxID=694430 RepID=L0JX10_9EURY|nr:twin-arginine translocation signal domain-containing protein [Natronococcus occultus]AGB37587.1 copper-binding protein, plastocyanin family [Natronococcus occultus SP4]
MGDNDHTTRRSVLKLTGAVGATAFIAGCNGEEEDDDPAEEPDDEDEPDDDEDVENGEVIEPGTTIEFDAQTAGWIGIEPEEIADEENPTLVLEEGEEYEIGWEEGDGSAHNIELVDEDDEIVDDYETDEESEGGEDQFIEFEATDEIAEYVCRPHETTMRGEIEIEANGNDEDDEEEVDDDEDDEEVDDEEEDDEEVDDEEVDDEEEDDDEMDDDEEEADDDNEDD